MFARVTRRGTGAVETASVAANEVSLRRRKCRLDQKRPTAATTRVVSRPARPACPARRRVRSVRWSLSRANAIAASNSRRHTVARRQLVARVPYRSDCFDCFAPQSLLGRPSTVDVRGAITPRVFTAAQTMRCNCERSPSNSRPLYRFGRWPKFNKASSGRSGSSGVKRGDKITAAA